MLDKDNIISASVSETVEKIIANAPLCVYFVQPQHTKRRSAYS